MTESDEKKVEQRLKEIKADASKGGYHINPDETFVKGLVSGLLTNRNRYGFESCPCRLTLGKKEDNLDIICPCDYRDADLSEFCCCYCALYVSSEIASGKSKAVAIPDRRLSEKEKKKNADNIKDAKPDDLKGCRVLNLKYPVFRCRVCGYLCSRDNPPKKCPICGVDADRFEKYF